VTTHPFPCQWGPQGRYFHRVNGVDYGPSAIGETEAAYKERVKGAYGNLRGVTFHDSNGERA